MRRAGRGRARRPAEPQASARICRAETRAAPSVGRGPMTMLAHKVALNPNAAQRMYFARAAGTARFAWNWALAEWQKQYKAGGKPSEMSLRRQLNAIKRAQFPWFRCHQVRGPGGHHRPWRAALRASPREYFQLSSRV